MCFNGIVHAVHIYIEPLNSRDNMVLLLRHRHRVDLARF
jgi:hypothetical protein